MKQPRVRLGEIQNGKLVNFTDSITWEFDTVLAILIRDGLTRYKKVNNGVPGKVVVKNEMDVEKASKEWNAILDRIIYLVDTYLKEDEEFLTDKERDMINNWVECGPLFTNVEEIAPGAVKLEFGEDAPPEIREIQEELVRINERQHRSMLEALDLIKEHWGEFGW